MFQCQAFTHAHNGMTFDDICEITIFMTVLYIYIYFSAGCCHWIHFLESFFLQHTLIVFILACFGEQTPATGSIQGDKTIEGQELLVSWLQDRSFGSQIQSHRVRLGKGGGCGREAEEREREREIQKGMKRDPHCSKLL